MPPQQSAPRDPEESSKKDKGTDLGDILLPKVSTPGKTLQSASRGDAGTLLQQEQSATLPRRPAPEPLLQRNDKKGEERGVPAIETYQGDIEKLVQTKNISAVSVAAAEAARRSEQPIAPSAWDTPNLLAQWGGRLIMIAAGLVLLCLTAGVAFLAYERTRPIAVLPTSEVSPFIAVEKVDPIVFESGILTRSTLMSNLQQERETLSITPGEMQQMLVTQASTTGASATQYAPIDVQRFVLTLAPGAPQELLRSLSGKYFLGLHSFDGNHAFLIFAVDAYSQGFSGMLKWEPRLQGDLSPLFMEVPRVQVPVDASSTPPSTPPQAEVAGFADAVVENFDSRVLRNNAGDIRLLWTFLVAHTVLIATNEATLHEVLTRRTLPQQSAQ